MVTRTAPEGADLQAAFSDEGTALTARGLRTVAGIGVPLVLGFAFFDYIRHPDVFADSIQIRLACAATILGALLLGGTPFGRRNVALLALIAVGSTGALVFAMQVLTSAHPSQYSTG